MARQVALAVVVGITWVMVRRWQVTAMVERSLPEIERLASAGQYVDAYRLGEDVARAAAFLASADANYITGESLLVDGGLVRGV